MTKTSTLRAARRTLAGLGLTVAGLLTAHSASAETSTANLSVSVSVVASCTIRSSGAQTVATVCSNGATSVVTVGQASNAISAATPSSTAGSGTMVTTIAF